ncbi:MAG: ribonucleoside-diphosphate reductase, adenosylcobalamin-dependent, partial [Candidatus Aenigmatarchaeota archaeon]
MNNNEWKGIDSISDELLPPKVKNLFATTDTINPEGHVRIQAAFQKHNHSGISKTCNFPNDATREDITNAFELAYDLEVKGLTVYRDGSRDVQVMTTRKENKLDSKEDILKALVDKYDSIDEMLKSEEFLNVVDLNGHNSITIRKGTNNEVKVQRIGNEDKGGRERRKRPNIIQGSTQKIETGQGSMFVTINEDSEGLFEVFASIGKSGGFTSSFTEAVGRLVSLALRSGIDPWQVIDELKGIRSPKMAWDKGAKIHSIPDGIAKAMERYLKGDARDVQESVKSFSKEDEDKTDGGNRQVKKMIERGINPECPDCGAVLEYAEGCVKCPSCGWSEC